MSRESDPTLGTVRDLYAVARGCGYPWCVAPLYIAVADLERPVLNCIMSRICALSPDGLRYDGSMTLEEWRSAPNLILLCDFHARVVNQRDSIYMAYDMRTWKIAQEDGAGTRISDHEAAQAIEYSRHAESVSIC